VEQAFRPALMSQIRFWALAPEVNMAIPPRGVTSRSTYFVTASTYQKKCILQSERTAGLFIDVLLHYRRLQKYLLHEFVVMPDHFHLLITPSAVTLERTMQFIKGGYSFRAKHELGLGGELWQTSFHDHRIRDAEEYGQFRKYIYDNPVRRGLCSYPEDFPFGSASGKFQLDDVPQRLKPISRKASTQV
jgi:putative transposase